MQRYWEWLVGRVPTWIAPNLITIVGLATNVFTTLVLVYYCPTATEQVCPHAQQAAAGPDGRPFRFPFRRNPAVPSRQTGR